MEQRCSVATSPQVAAAIMAKTKITPCKICQVLTTENYNGIAVCTACKKFFLRNQNQLNVFSCLTGRNNCDISRVGREEESHWPRKQKLMCRRCRLLKAFEVGLLPRETVVIQTCQRPLLQCNAKVEYSSDNSGNSSSSTSPRESTESPRPPQPQQPIPLKRRWLLAAEADDEQATAKKTVVSPLEYDSRSSVAPSMNTANSMLGLPSQPPAAMLSSGRRLLNSPSHGNKKPSQEQCAVSNHASDTGDRSTANMRSNPASLPNSFPPNSVPGFPLNSLSHNRSSHEEAVEGCGPRISVECNVRNNDPTTSGTRPVPSMPRSFPHSSRFHLNSESHHSASPSNGDNPSLHESDADDDVAETPSSISTILTHPSLVSLFSNSAEQCPLSSASRSTISSRSSSASSKHSSVVAVNPKDLLPPPMPTMVNSKYTASVQAHFEFVLEAFCHLRDKFQIMPVLERSADGESPEVTWNWLTVDFEVTSRVVLEYLKKLPVLRKQNSLSDTIILRRCFGGVKALAVTSVIKKRSFLSSFDRITAMEEHFSIVMRAEKTMDDCIGVMESATESLKPSMSEAAILAALFVYQAIQKDLEKDSPSTAANGIESSISVLYIALETFVSKEGGISSNERVAHLKQLVSMMTLISTKWQLTASQLLSQVPTESSEPCKKLADTFLSEI